MNPSSKGWLKKLLKFAEKDSGNCSPKHKFYKSLKNVGFIYGSNISALIKNLRKTDFTQEEYCKVNYLLSLFYINKINNSKIDFESNLMAFYNNIGYYKPNFINELIGDDIESIIHKRIQIDNNIFSKKYSFFVTNFLLFVDILSYDVFLKNPNITRDYQMKMENYISEIVIKSLSSKNEKSDYEITLIKLLESSLRSSDIKKSSFKAKEFNNFSELERNYFLDLVCMASWTEKSDYEINNEFIAKFKFNHEEISQAMSDLNNFYNNNKNNVSILSTQNLAVRLYEHSTNTVKKLITRNSKRLFQELKESKELVKLISESTTRNLSSEEQNKIQEQLMDILKSIPSLAIFMLPGGAILLPLFIKFIPKLLPSAFDENRIDDK